MRLGNHSIMSGHKGIVILLNDVAHVSFSTKGTVLIQAICHANTVNYKRFSTLTPFYVILHKGLPSK